ncbi:predicted protein [Verticillium alfalfae VaMs.102]|uniref:Predicted protein n=1 Tax=Verticillium alfalfae (strain VaMs.102 / ATCC MYA-4576 / FGSC 10136) TaxID=526221 RepID=C9SSL5_VERA1|nr:predicted protein [Verticillium alfalfae VaMs.102]EEY21780.1 predicted protein [Verticillium alfalfae VaMs.102]
MARPMIAQLTRALFNTIDSSFDEPSTPAIHLTTADNPALDNGDVSSDDEPNDIPNIILPTTPRPRSSPHAELVTSGHPRQRMQLDGEEALVELHPLMDDVENDLFIPLNLEHLNSALAVPPRGISGPAAPSPFPLNPSQRPGIQRKISQPFAEHDVGGEPPRQTEPTDKSPIESNDLPSQTARARLLEEDREGEVSHTNGALMVEEIRRETACATVEHARVTATEEEDSKQWPGKAHDMTPSAPVQTMAGGRDMENGSVPRESEPREATMDLTEQAVLSQPLQQAPKNPGPSGDDDIDEPSADSAGEATENLQRLATRPLPEWIHGMETWNNRLIDDPLSVAMRYESETCSRLGRQMLCLAKVCKAIPRRPGTRKQFNYFGDTDSNDKSLVPKYIEGVDNHVEEVTMKMLGTDSSTPAKSRRQVAMDIRRNIIPLAIYTVELVFLAGASAVGVGRLNAIPEHAEHTSQTLQLLRRVLVWVGRLERAAAEEFANASNRQQDMGPDASPLMLDRHGLDIMIQKLQKAVGDSYTALNKQIDKVNRPITRQESHLDEFAEANLQNTQRGESRQAKRKRKDDEKQAAREEAKRRCIESVIRCRKRVPTAPGTSGRTYRMRCSNESLRALKYSQKPDVENIAESMKYHVEDVWDVIALLKRAAEAQQRAGGSRMPEGLRRSFEHLYRR